MKKTITDFAVPITDVPMRGNLYDKAVATIEHGEPVNRKYTLKKTHAIKATLPYRFFFGHFYIRIIQ